MQRRGLHAWVDVDWYLVKALGGVQRIGINQPWRFSFFDEELGKKRRNERFADAAFPLKDHVDVVHGWVFQISVEGSGFGFT